MGKKTFAMAVAVCVRGKNDTYVVIDDLECDDEQAAHEAARHHALLSLDALARVPSDEWQTRIVSVHEIEDIKPKPQPESPHEKTEPETSPRPRRRT